MPSPLSKRFRRLAFEALEDRRMLSFGLTTSTNSYTVDTGAGLVFSIARTTANSASIGDMTSATLNGTQFEAPYSYEDRYSHYESGLSSSAVVTATVDPNGNWILIACNDTGSSGTGVIQYYIARNGYDNIYMATYSPGPDSPSPGEMRYIMYTNPSVLTNIPAPSDNNGNNGAIESTDVFGFANGTTSSKYYGEYEAIDTQTYGDTGNGVGVFMNIGNRETSSGGPFFKDIDFQTNELYNYTFSGHSQTENFRPGLKGPYALLFTSSTATPAAPDYSWIDSSGLGSYMTGYVGASGRGTLSGTASGVPSTLQATVAISNAADQYWATPNATTGAYTITGVLPGTYTETLYQGELAVGTKTVTIAAAQTTSANIVDSFYTPANPVFSLGTWDGTPLGFLNANLITDMHPTDVRMSPWAADSTGVTNFTVGTDPVSDWPMAEWHTETGSTQNGVTTYEDTDNRITFTLTAAQAATAQTLLIGLTRLYYGRPTISVNSGAWNSAVPSQYTEPDSRGLTTGNWRGNNCLYAFNISTSALKAGTNTIDIYCTSGSTGTIYSGYQIYDAIDLVPTSSAYTPTIASVTITPSSTIGVNGTRTFVAVAKDANGNVLPANFDWSAAKGTIDPNGDYVAPASAGTDTISVTATLTQTPGYSASSSSSSTIGSAVTATANITINVVGPPTVVTPAAANPSPVTGVSTALSVLGGDGAGESVLTYTWSLTGTPPAAVSFSANGTNPAKNATATFSKAGTYSFQVTINDPWGNSTTSSVNVTVQHTAQSASISPASASITAGGTQQFTLIGQDQFGQAFTITDPSVNWQLTGPGSLGASSGLYAPPYAAGSATVQASYGTFVISPATVTVSGQAQWNASATASWTASGIWKDSISGSTLAAPGTGTRSTMGDTVLFASAAGPVARLDGASPTLAGITFNNATTSYTVAQGSGGSLILQGGNGATVSVVAGSHTISAPVHLASSTTINAAAATTLTMSGPIDGSAALTKTGGGTLYLSGANNYTGGTVVSAGAVIVPAASALSSGSNLTIGANVSQFMSPSIQARDAALAQYGTNR